MVHVVNVEIWFTGLVLRYDPHLGGPVFDGSERGQLTGFTGRTTCGRDIFFQRPESAEEALSIFFLPPFYPSPCPDFSDNEKWDLLSGICQQ